MRKCTGSSSLRVLVCCLLLFCFFPLCFRIPSNAPSSRFIAVKSVRADDSFSPLYLLLACRLRCLGGQVVWASHFTFAHAFAGEARTRRPTLTFSSTAPGHRNAEGSASPDEKAKGKFSNSTPMELKAGEKCVQQDSECGPRSPARSRSRS